MTRPCSASSGTAVTKGGHAEHTDLTLVRLLLCVGDHVVLEVLALGGLEGAAGLRALEGVPRVDQAVCLQLALVGRGEATDVAQVVLGGAVGHHVALQGVLPLEAVAANLHTLTFACNTGV